MKYTFDMTQHTCWIENGLVNIHALQARYQPDDAMLSIIFYILSKYKVPNSPGSNKLREEKPEEATYIIYQEDLQDVLMAVEQVASLLPQKLSLVSV